VWYRKDSWFGELNIVMALNLVIGKVQSIHKIRQKNGVKSIYLVFGIDCIGLIDNFVNDKSQLADVIYFYGNSLFLG